MQILNYKNKSYIFYYSTLILRRLVFVLTIFYLSEYLYFQIVIFILGNILYLLYLIYGKPISTGLYIEVFNEVITLILSVFLLIFTDFVKDADIKYRTGYAFIVLFIIDVIVNFVLLIKDSYYSLRFFVKKLRYRWRLR